MSVIALIGARSGSSLKDKNIRMLAGHPLLAYSIKAAQLAGIERVIVSTDSREYADIAKKYDASVPFMRPAEISGADSTDYDFIAHALYWLRVNWSQPPDVIVHLRPTTPLRDPQAIKDALAYFAERGTTLRSAHAMSESAFKCCTLYAGTYWKPLPPLDSMDLDVINDPRQSFTPTYHLNGYVDILRADFILANKKIHGNKVRAFLTPPVVEVDTEDDFDLLEYQVSRNPELVRRLFG